MKHYFITSRRCISLVTALALVVGQLTVPPVMEASHLGSSTASAGSAPPPSVAATQSFQPDLFTGRATTGIPIAVPPGRKGMQPALGLAYSSSGRNSWVGTGWGLDLGFIERSTKNGPPRYDTTDTYTFMFQGVASDLVKIPDGTYRAKDEGLFMRFENKGISGWEVRDKSGTRYLFGGSPDSEQANTSGLFRWCLRKVLDTNGNFLTVAYAEDQGQGYLSRIDYTGHETSGVQDLAPANYVQFTTESRPDTDASLRSGAQVTTALRLKEIAAYAQGQLAHKYVLAYTQSQRTGRSLLTGVTQFGTDGVTSLPATTFTYQDAAPSYTLSSNSGAMGLAAWNLRKANVDTGHENFGCVSPYAGLPWGSPTVVSSSADLGCMNATVGSDGSITVNGCNDHFMHAWTWVYASSPKNITLSYNGSEACLFREDSSGIQNLSAGSVSVPLQAGWSILHLTGYHQHSGWTNVMSSPLKNLVTIMNPSQFIKPQLAGDVDGDGMTDLITFDAVGSTWAVSKSRGVSFSASSTWLTGFGGTSSTPLLGDWNADGRTDIAMYNSGSWSFATSTATSFQTGTVSPLSFGSGIPLTGDFNGDGVIDIGTYSNGSWQVALGTGSGFSPAGSFSRSLGSSSSTPLTGDFNGDGYTDIGVVDSGTVTVAPSNGNSFSQSAVWLTSFGSANYTTADFNGDGLTDAAYYDKPSGQVRYAASTGAQFSASTTLPVTFSLRSTDDNIQVGDFNGDGFADPSVFNATTGTAELTASQGAQPDLLTTVANGIGGTTALTYQPSTKWDNTGSEDGVPDLPFVLPVVTRVDASDGMGNTYTTHYDYAGGRYDAPTKEFRGFRHVDATDTEGLVTHHWFLQAADTKGRVETQFTTNFQEDQRFSEVDNEYLTTTPYPGVTFTSLHHQDVREYNGDSTFRESHTWFYFDQFGNLTNKLELGEDPQTGDERQTSYFYTVNETEWIVNTLVEVHVHEGTHSVEGPMVSRRFLYYDGNTSYTWDATVSRWIPQIPVSKGNLTREREWLVADPKNPVNAVWLYTWLTYDPYGNVKTVTDAATPSRTTTNTYDPQTFTYLTQITNALGHSRQLAYDPHFGQVTSSTDQNNVTTTTEYDKLGRVTKVIGPTDTAALPTVSYEYQLSSTPPSKSVVHTRIQSGQAGVLTAYTFTDGLGRTIQTRTPAEDPTKQTVGGAVELDSRGLVIKQWVPYLDPFSASYVPPPLASLAPPVVYTYDLTGRLLTTTDPDGSVTSTSYDDLSVTVTDANTHSTRRTTDIYGRLIKVEEFNDGQTYTTTYQYDVLDNLLQVTDQAGNITRITYDSLGRKIAMDDPDMGHWTYAYDTVDNLASQTDARGVTISFAYDALNRLTQKSYSAAPPSSIFLPPSVLYTYDNPAKSFSKGKLTEITDGSGSSSFEYDKLGRLTKESKTIDGTTYTIQRAYDLLGRLTSLTYPDNELATYTYNNQGGIETITSRLGDSAPQPIVSNIDYNAAGQILNIAYGNGVVTDYSYNPQTLRLESLRTQNSALQTLQDFSYQFDPVGNVKDIVDRVHTGTQSFWYDDLNRLIRARGTSYGDYQYAYDPIGNMTEKEGVSMSYGLPDGSKPHAVTSVGSGLGVQGSGVSLTYDANGNLLEKRPQPPTPNPEQISQLFSYDGENRLVEVKTAQEETISVTFKAGWNFFSLPILPDDGAVVVLLPNFAADFEQIAKFDAATNGFKHYVGNPKFDDFSDLEYGTGYQVYAKRDVTISFQGKVPTQRVSRSVPAGWELLGSSVLTDTAVATWLSGVPYTDVRAYDPTTGTLPPATQAQAAKAYWVRMSGAVTWTPPLPKDVSTKFVFDGDGGKVKQITASGTTTYLGEAYEKDPTGKTTKYVFAGGLRVAAKDSAGALRFYHGDHLGSSNVVTDGTGVLVEHTEHLPYGAISRTERANAQTGQPANPPFGFTGQRQDTTSGLILFPARAYDPELGRFLQPDPFVQDPSDPQTLNRYSYVRNNPVNLVDPSGHFVFLAFLGAIFLSAVVGATVSIAIGAATGQIHSWKDVGRFAAVGAVSGAILGGGGYLIGAQLALAGTAKTLAEIGLAAASGAVGGGVDSRMQGGSFSDGLLPGAAGGVLGYGASRAIGAVAQRWGLPTPEPGAPSQQVGLMQSFRQWLKNDPVEVFRVEGATNTRISIGPGGQVGIPDTSRTLFLNFGQQNRANAFFQQRLRQGLPGTTIKSFKVNRSFLDQLRQSAVKEAEAKSFPNNPFLVDVAKYTAPL